MNSRKVNVPSTHRSLMKFTTAALILALSVSSAFADHHEEKKKGDAHDKEHSHVGMEKKDHDHDDAHHKDHDHKAHHPSHDEEAAKKKK